VLGENSLHGQLRTRGLSTARRRSQAKTVAPLKMTEVKKTGLPQVY